MTRFERDTALTRTGPGTFEGRVDPGWRIVRGANGGHLAAIVLRAMTIEIDDPSRSPRSMTVHFTRVPAEDTIDVAVSVERAGRSMTTVTARMEQEGKLVAIALAAFSTDRTGPEFSDVSMPEVPLPEDIEPVPEREDFPFGHRFDFRRALGPQADERSERAEHGVWLRLREPQPLDAIMATQFCDAWAPAVFSKLGMVGGGGGVPTFEMTYHYRETLPLEGAKPDDWYLAVFRTQTARGGFIEEDGWLWSREGTLVAQSRQMAILEG